MVWFIAWSSALIIAIAIQPGASPTRRLIGATLDSCTITYFSYAIPEHSAPLYFLYLWIIFGHGFRFGRSYLFFTLILSFTGFGAAVFYSDFWKENSTLGVGLWIGMLLVSLYISTLVKKLTDALEYADVSQKNLTVALKSAEQANQAKRRFISSVSHEMRTPLNAIIGMGNLVQHTKLDEEQATMVHTINNASQMMLSLIEDVLDFSKIEAGKIIIENTEFRLRTLVHSTADIFKHQAYEKGLTFNVLIQPEAPNFLVGDPKHLRQVLVNLIGNAVKFTEAGYVSLNVLLVKESVDNAEIRFEIIDTGIGITNEAQGKIFESFIQADDSTTRRYGGTGLGTTISKQLVELMGGTIGLSSESGKGSTFWFELQLAKEKSESSDKDTPTTSSHNFSFLLSKPTPQLIKPASSYKVLVADDNSMNRLVLQKILEREGHTCILVENGELALDILADEPVDAVIFDMNMPVISGLEAAKAYRFMTTNETRAPIIMFSADVTVGTIEQCKAAGIDRFLPKPIDVNEFLSTLEEITAKFKKCQPFKPAFIQKQAIPIIAQPGGTTTFINAAALMELEQLGQNVQFLKNLISAFKADTAITIKQLDIAFHMNKYAEIKELVHALKGSAISLGAIALRQKCHDLENASRDEIIETGKSCFEKMKKIHASTCLALDEYINTREVHFPHNQPSE